MDNNGDRLGDIVMPRGGMKQSPAHAVKSMTKLSQSAVAMMLLLIASCCNSGIAQDNRRNIAQFAHTAWSAKDGAPSVIQALAQTNDGYLWLGTSTGLYRFDGVTFEHYSLEAEAKLISPNVSCLLALPDGDLWIGFATGVIGRLMDDRMTVYASQDGVPSGRVLGLAQDAAGAIWAAGTGGLARLEGNRWRLVGEEWNFPGKSAAAVFRDRQGTLWVATEDTIVSLPKGARSFQETGIHIGLVDQIAQASDGKLWMAEVTRSVRPIPLGNRESANDETEVRVGSHAILFDREGALWITTIGDGMRRVSSPDQFIGKPGRFSDDVEAFSSKDGLSNDFVRSIFQDREGNIWVGTTDGLDRFRKTNLVPIRLPFPAQDSTLVAGDAGDFWVAGEGLDRIHGASAIKEGDPRKMGYIFTSYRAPAGDIWWAAVGGIFHLSKGHLSRVPLPDGVDTSNVETIQMTEDRSGMLWAAVARDGLHYLSKNAWKRFDVADESALGTPTAAFTDATGRLWFGYDDGSVIDLETKGTQTLLQRHDAQIGSVRTIRGTDQNVWIGGDSGLAFLDGAGFRKVIPSDLASFGRISGIEKGSDGSLWLAEGRGVIQVRENEVRKSLQDPAHRTEYKLFDAFDGLPGTFQNVSRNGREIQTSDGRLWFVATNGVAWINPADIFENDIPPPVLIRSVEVDGKEYDPRANLTLPPLMRRLQIGFTALSLTNPEHVRFRYRLDEVDKDWEEAGTRRQAFYTMLAPGRYRFRVIACNNDGVWNQQGATLSFVISPAWYQTIWFRLFCVLLGITFLYSLYLLRLRQREAAMSLRFNERLNERTRIARDLHDTLLQTIQGSKLAADHARESLPDIPRTQKLLNQLSDWLGRASLEGRTALESLHATEAEDLAAALRTILDDCRANYDIEFSLHISGSGSDMTPLMRDEIYWIAYEAIRNACKHSKAHHVSVNLVNNPVLELRIADDGQGIPQDTLRNGKPGHFGLKGMRERAAQIGANLAISSSPQTGTQVSLVVPRKRSSWYR
jgi:signal transduction histidine kinase/ligand-binding sensor domain-containing protein